MPTINKLQVRNNNNTEYINLLKDENIEIFSDRFDGDTLKDIILEIAKLSDLISYVPITRTINGQELTGDIIIATSNPLSAGTGISIISDIISNTDLGSSAISAHNITYNHTNIHAPHSDDQDLSGYSLTTHNHDTIYAPVLGIDENYVSDTQLSNIHAPNSDDQDLSGLLPKVGGIATSIRETIVPTITLQTADIDWSTGHIIWDYAGTPSITSFNNIPNDGTESYLTVTVKHTGGVRTLGIPISVLGTLSTTGTSGGWDIHTFFCLGDGIVRTGNSK